MTTIVVIMPILAERTQFFLTNSMVVETVDIKFIPERTVVDQVFECSALARHFGRKYEVGGADFARSGLDRRSDRRRLYCDAGDGSNL